MKVSFKTDIPFCAIKSNKITSAILMTQYYTPKHMKNVFWCMVYCDYNFEMFGDRFQ